MRQTTILLLVWVVLAPSTAGVAAQGKTDADNASTELIRDLIGQLGSAKYNDRDRATRELELLGPKALKQLREALPSGDAETRYRAGLLVRKLEDQELAAALLAPKRVRLNVKDLSVADAVAELAKHTGYPIHLVGDLSSLSGRKVTLDTGDKIFWDALEQLATQAGLVETTSPANNYGAVMGKKGFYPAAAPTQAGIHLTPGKPVDTPVFQAGSIRLRLVRATNLPGGEIELMFDVSAEPRLRGFGSGGQPRMEKVVDDQGQNLACLPLHEPAADNTANGFGNGNGNVIIINGNVVSTLGGPSLQAQGPFQVTLRLAKGSLPAKGLKELTGKLRVQAVVDSAPQVVVDKILQAAGQSAKGKNGAVLHVRNVEQLPGGDVRVQVGLENAPGQGMGGFGGGNVVIIQGGGNVQINGNKVVIGGTGNPQAGAGLPRLVDGAGKSFTLVQHTSPSLTINNGQVSQVTTLVYRPQPGQGPPTQMVLPGHRLFTFEVPFTLQNIVLH
jgi:hypothetical protein